MQAELIRQTDIFVRSYHELFTLPERHPQQLVLQLQW